MPSATDTDVIVIGAGLAGLGAATALRERSIRCVVLEASSRIGGRAWTAHPPELDGAWFEMGAIWLHWAERNPLVSIARAAGMSLLRADELRRKRTFVGMREATASEYADYDDAWDRYERVADEILASAPDAPLAAVADRRNDDPWALTVEAFEGPVICVAEAEKFSLRDWRTNVLGGSNLVPDGGIGAFVERHLGVGLDIRLGTPATRIIWNGAGGRVSVETPRGVLSARHCIVTVSTGVLACGGLRFDPALPAATREAIASLPMGLAMKVVLRATGTDRLDLPAHCSVDRRIMQRGENLMPFQCWPFGRDYVQGWIGADTAWALARDGEAAAVEFTLAQLRAIFGGRVDRLFAGGARLVTRWDADPWTRGAYSWVPVGQAHARARLAEPLGDGHLLFAGEACHDGFAGTLAGAWISGLDAAARCTGG
jgi:monoamine oxidase